MANPFRNHGCPSCGCKLFQEVGPCAGEDLLIALKALLSQTMYKDHPAQSDLAVAAIKKAERTRNEVD